MIQFVIRFELNQKIWISVTLRSKSITKIQLKKSKSQIPIFLGAIIKFDLLYAYIYIYVQNYMYIYIYIYVIYIIVYISFTIFLWIKFIILGIKI